MPLASPQSEEIELKKLSLPERKRMAQKLLQEQVIDQRNKLSFWKELTKQPAQIDTGYIAQHLVSLITSVPGFSMRGKGDDLEDGSEVKSANFLDSLDKRGAIAPRWNFSSNDLQNMKLFLELPYLYLVSMDLNATSNVRVRVWRIDPRQHVVFKQRYEEWMKKLGIPKLKDPKRPGVNFQLFPPRFKTEESFARHGNGRADGFTPIKIELEGVQGAKKIFHAIEARGGVQIILLEP